MLKLRTSHSRPEAGGEIALLAQITAQLEVALAQGSTVHATRFFKLFVWPTPDPFYRNVAVPIAAPTSAQAGWGPALVELMALFSAAGRPPRLEFFAELWPGLAGELEALGLRAQLTAPVMVAARPPLGIAPSGGTTVRYLHAADPLSLLAAASRAAAAAFGQLPGPAAPGELQTLRQRLDSGLVRALVLLEGSAPVAGASLVGGREIAELAGVWTRADRRRRGLAWRACERLLRPFFARGGELAWLSAGNAAAERLYRSLGFTTIGTQIDICRPPLDPSHLGTYANGRGHEA